MDKNVVEAKIQNGGVSLPPVFTHITVIKSSQSFTDKCYACFICWQILYVGSETPVMKLLYLNLLNKSSGVR